MPKKSPKNKKSPLTGHLLAHGKAPFEHNPENQANYFVSLETQEGERTLWGIDLERAVEQGNVTVGDKIAIEYQGKQAVTVSVKERDEQGKVVGEKQITTHRNTWLVEKADAFREGKRQEVVEKHPDLAPAYGTLAAANKFSEKTWPDNPAEQQRFNTMIKETLADKIQKGKKIPATRIRVAREPLQQQHKERER